MTCTFVRSNGVGSLRSRWTTISTSMFSKSFSSLRMKRTWSRAVRKLKFSEKQMSPRVVRKWRCAILFKWVNGAFLKCAVTMFEHEVIRLIVEEFELNRDHSKKMFTRFFVERKIGRKDFRIRWKFESRRRNFFWSKIRCGKIRFSLNRRLRFDRFRFEIENRI